MLAKESPFAPWTRRGWIRVTSTGMRELGVAFQASPPHRTLGNCRHWCPVFPKFGGNCLAPKAHHALIPVLVTGIQPPCVCTAKDTCPVDCPRDAYGRSK